MARRREPLRSDEATWSDAHRMKVERCIRKYRFAAKRANQDYKRPDEGWLVQYFEKLCRKFGPGYARCMARYVGHHFGRNGTPVLTDGSRVQAVLGVDDSTDPLSLNLSMLGQTEKVGPAQRFADAAYAGDTYRSYASHTGKWISWCTVSSTDPLRPYVSDLITYFEMVAIRVSPGAVRNQRNAIGHYLRKNGCPDVTRDPEIVRLLQGISRMKPQRRIAPMTADERRTLLASLESEGVGVRDRVGILLIAFTPMGYERVSLIDVEHVIVHDHGVLIASLNDDPPFFVGTHQEQDLDIVYWTRRLLSLLPETGPMFRAALLRRFRFGEERLTSMSLLNAIRRIANHCGVCGEDLLTRLQLLFDAELHNKVSDIVRTRHNNRRNLPAHVERLSRDIFAKKRHRRAASTDQEQLI